MAHALPCPDCQGPGPVRLGLLWECCGQWAPRQMDVWEAIAEVEQDEKEDDGA